jgi:hypothetical protein
MVLRPTSDHGHATYSSLVPYETPVGHGLLWARAELSGEGSPPRSLDEVAARAEAGDVRFVVGIVTEDRDRLLGEVRIDERLDADATEALRFDPENAGPPLQPTGALQQLRERAYRASQRFRPTPEGDEEATEEAVAQEAAGS